jgi:hypothetical protein
MAQIGAQHRDAVLEDGKKSSQQVTCSSPARALLNSRVDHNLII